MGWQVRKGSKLNIEAVSHLWLKMVNELAPKYSPNREWWVKIANNMITSGLYNLFVAEDGLELVGFIDFFSYPEPSTGKIHAVGQHFYVLPGYRKTSLPGILYKRAVSMAKIQNCSLIEIMCFDGEKSFWEKKGYKPIRTMVRREIHV